MEKDEFKIKSYNTKELADQYGVTRITFRNWLKRLKLDLGPRIGNYFSPTQVKIIVDHLGKPFIWLWSLGIGFMKKVTSSNRPGGVHHGQVHAKENEGHHQDHPGGGDDASGGADGGSVDVSV